RSYSAGAKVFGSRRPNSSSGFVSALTYSCRYSPGFPAMSCAIVIGATIASSSGPPPDRIPVTNRDRFLCGVFMFNALPICTPERAANDLPITHSCAPSLNHCPSTCHQGFVFSMPVTYVLPSGTDTTWPTQVPIKVVCASMAGVEYVCEDFVQASTGTSTAGAKPTMLFRQKIVLSLPRSDSGK